MHGAGRQAFERRSSRSSTAALKWDEIRVPSRTFQNRGERPVEVVIQATSALFLGNEGKSVATVGAMVASITNWVSARGSWGRRGVNGRIWVRLLWRVPSGGRHVVSVELHDQSRTMVSAHLNIMHGY